jgi:hypothetical protein
MSLLTRSLFFVVLACAALVACRADHTLGQTETVVTGNGTTNGSGGSCPDRGRCASDGGTQSGADLAQAQVGADGDTIACSNSAGCCRNNADCTGGLLCYPPGSVSYCNLLPDARDCVTTCTVDADCSHGLSCDPWGTGPKFCGLQPCTTTTPCASDFDCTPNGPTMSQCERKGCQSDADCVSGPCVAGGCYPTFGVCAPMRI